MYHNAVKSATGQDLIPFLPVPRELDDGWTPSGFTSEESPLLMWRVYFDTAMPALNAQSGASSWAVLFYLVEQAHGSDRSTTGPLTLQQIADALHMTRGTANRILHLLMSMRLIADVSPEGAERAARDFLMLHPCMWELETDQRDDWREFRRLRPLVFARDEQVCRYCGQYTDAPQCDHVIPWTRGGKATMENLVTACRRCNGSKNGRTLEEWKR